MPRFSCGFAILMLASPLAAQTQSGPNSIVNPGSAAPAKIMFKKPAEILQFASVMNGVDVPSAKPWHVELTYDQFDEDGDNVHSGTIEEYYVEPKKYRLSFTNDEMSQTDIATGSGLYRIGEQRWLNPGELQVLNEALRPFYRRELNARCIWGHFEPCTALNKINWHVGGLKLQCIIVDHLDASISDNALPKYCFENDTVPLRYTRGQGWDETIYNKFIAFQDRYVATEIDVTRAGKPFLKINIEELESLNVKNEALFTPLPGSSGPLGGRITLSSDILVDQYQVRPVWPAFPHHVPGKVNVRFVVGKDGTVVEAEALDGPEVLHKPSLDAVRQWQFRPYLILGEPVEVESRTVFEFR
jgi:Gram-negative bacterial TonB protein C-terminal